MKHFWGVCILMLCFNSIFSQDEIVYNGHKEVSNFTFSKDGNYLIDIESKCYVDSIYVWEVKSGNIVKAIYKDHKCDCSLLENNVISPDTNYYLNLGDKALTIYKIPEFEKISSINIEPSNPSIAYQPKGNIFAFYNSNIINFYELPSLKKLNGSINIPPCKGLPLLKFNDKGNILVVRTDNKILFYDTKTYKQIGKEIKSGDRITNFKIAFSSNDSTIAVYYDDGEWSKPYKRKCKIYNLYSSEVLGEIPLEAACSGAPFLMNFLPGNQSIIIIKDQKGGIYSTSTFKLVKEMNGIFYGDGLTFKNDYMVQWNASYSDLKVNYFNAKDFSPEKEFTMNLKGKPLKEDIHWYGVKVSVSPDGRKVARIISNQYGIINIYNIQTGTIKVLGTTPEKVIAQEADSPTSNTLLTQKIEGNSNASLIAEKTTTTLNSSSDDYSIANTASINGTPPTITSFYLQQGALNSSNEWGLYYTQNYISTILSSLNGLNILDPEKLVSGANYQGTAYQRIQKTKDELLPVYANLPVQYYFWGSISKSKDYFNIRLQLWHQNTIVAEKNLEVSDSELPSQLLISVRTILSNIGITISNNEMAALKQFNNTSVKNIITSGNFLANMLKSNTANPDEAKKYKSAALSLASEMIKNYPNYSWGYSNYAFCSHNPEETMEMLTRANALNPKNIDALYGLSAFGEILKKSGYLDYYKKLAMLNPSLIQYVQSYLSAYYYAGEYNVGLQEAQRMLELFQQQNNQTGKALASAWLIIYNLTSNNSFDIEKYIDQIYNLDPKYYDPSLSSAFCDLAIELDAVSTDKTLKAIELSYKVAKTFSKIPSIDLEKIQKNYIITLVNSGNANETQSILQEYKNSIKTLHGENSIEMSQYYGVEFSLQDMLGNYSLANQIAQKAINFYAQNPDQKNSNNYAEALSNLAISWFKLNNIGLMTENYNKALEIYQKNNAYLKVAYIMNNQATNLYRLNDLKKSQELFSQCIQYINQHQINDVYLQISLYSSAGMVEYKLNNWPKAEQLSLQAMNLAEKNFSTSDPGYFKSANNLGFLYLNENKLQEATNCLTKALNGCLKANSNLTTSYKRAIVNNLAFIKIQENKFTEAEQLCKQVLADNKLQDQVNDPSLSNIYANMSQLYIKQNKYIDAETYLSKDIESQLKQFNALSTGATEEQRLNVAYDTRQALDLYFAYASRLRKNDPNVRVKAFEYWNQRKGLVLESFRNNFNDNNPEVVKLYHQLNDVKNQLSNIYINGISSSNQSDYLEKTTDLEKQQQDLEVKMAALGADVSTNIGFSKIAQALPTNVALVDFARIRFTVFGKTSAEDKLATWYYAFIVKKGSASPELIELGDSQIIEKAISNYKIAIVQLKDQVTINSNAQTLYNILFKPLEPYISGKNDIWVSTDGQLSILPLEVMMDNTNRFLAEKYNFNYLTSSRDIVRSKNSTNPGKSVVIGNPDFNWKDPDMMTSVSPTSSMFDGISFNMLPSTALEANDVAKTIGLTSVNLISGDAVRKNTFMAIQSPKILHIATHGFFLDNVNINIEEGNRGFKKVVTSNETSNTPLTIKIENPLLRSGLVLAGANNYLSTYSLNKTLGIVSAQDIMQMNLSGTELVTLSACETGLGKTVNGEGVYGLQRSFIIAGAQSLLMSMWSVADKETQELIGLFYQYWLNEGRCKAEALRMARLKMIETTKQRYGNTNPYYWGAFVLMGK